MPWKCKKCGHALSLHTQAGHCVREGCKPCGSVNIGKPREVLPIIGQEPSAAVN